MAATARPGSATLSPAGAPVPAPYRRPLLSRASFGHVVMVLAGLLAFVLVLAVLKDRDATVPVAVAAHDIQPGAVVDLDDLRIVQIPADSPLVGSLVEPASLRNRPARATRRLPQGTALNRGDVSTNGASVAVRAMSIPISTDHAVGGELVAGDRVDVIDSSGEARYVLRDAEVLAVGSRSSDRGLGQVRSQYFVTVSIDSDSALSLAQAIAQGKVEIVRSTGGEGT